MHPRKTTRAGAVVMPPVPASQMNKMTASPSAAKYEIATDAIR